MNNAEFDRAMIAACFELAAEKGWARLSIAEAGRRAGLPLDRARLRFPGRSVLLVRFGRMADQAALAQAAPEGPPRDRLFDLVMRRIDVLQAHRAGVLALLHGLPSDPGHALFLALATLRSMAWLLEAAGMSSTGPAGRLRATGLLGVWLWTLRAWERDASTDLGATMAALDRALTNAERWAGWLLDRGGAKPAVAELTPEPIAPAPGPEPEPPASI
jgi:ubiquinone biosynthesis protein COQ9